MHTVLAQCLNNAFRQMKISHKSITNPKQLIYRLNFPQSELCGVTVTLMINELFSAEVHALIAQGITADIRSAVLEKINAVNEEFQFAGLRLDQYNDVYSCQQFILVGSERTMCQQIIVNLLAFCDIHSRASAEIQAVIHG